jgi:predicted PurR-regulated permease PerM
LGVTTAARSLVVAATAGGVLVGALALWQLRIVLALLFLAVILASGMRPGIEALARRGVPRWAGVLAHYAILAALVALLVVVGLPQVVSEANGALAAQGDGGGALRSLGRELARQVAHWARDSATPSELLDRALATWFRAFAVVAGTAFVLGCAGYWTLERDRIQRVVGSRLTPERRRRFLAAWDRAELRLGAYVRGQLLLIAIVATTLSTLFRVIGLPYWLVLGIFAGLVEIVPMVGPLAAGVVAVGVGLTVSVHTALLAAAAVYGLRLVQDYVLVPRVIGHAVELPPLLTIVLVAVAGVALGPAMVPFATPFAAVVAAVARGDGSPASGARS